MGKFQEWKSYVTSPPPELLAKTEVQGHFLGILGIIFTAVLLIKNGLWYVIFAFIFSILVSWSQGMSALARYRVFMSFKPEETYEYILDDKSFTRRRQRVYKKRYNIIVRFIIFICCFVIASWTSGIENIIKFTTFSYWHNILFTLKLGLETFIIYFIFTIVMLSYFTEKIQRKKQENKIGISQVA